MSSDNADGVIARLRKRYEEEKDLLVYDVGKYIEAEDCADAWRRINSFMLTASFLKLYRNGNRHIVPRITVVIKNWGNLIPLESFGYNPKLRMNRLERNYLNVESLEKCREIMSGRRADKPYSSPISFGTGRKRTPPCMVGGTFFWNPGRLLADFYLRASEVTKTLAADLHFLNRVIKGDPSRDLEAAVPDYMSENLGPVRLHLNQAYLLAQWFPLIDLIMPGYPLNTYDHRFHRMCIDSLRKAQDLDYESKWKPEKRIINFYRKRIKLYATDDEGRVLRGPSFFPHPKIKLPEDESGSSS